MEKIWLKNYPPGVAAEIDTNAFASLREVLRRTCERFADRPAYSHQGVTLTYAELDQHSRDFAAYLQDTLKLKKGDRVALMLPNVLQYPIALFGVLRAGMVVVSVNPQYTAPELAHQLTDAGAVAIVVLENFARTLQDALQKAPALRLAVVITKLGDMFPVVKKISTQLVLKYLKKGVPKWAIAGTFEFNNALRQGHFLPLHPVSLKHSDLAFLQYTGGTTGVAKGAMLTHGNLVANLQQLGAWLGRDLRQGEETLACPLPLCHVFALTASLVFFKLGAHIVLTANPRELPALLSDLKKHPFTALIGVNSLYRTLLDTPEFARVPTQHLKLAIAGGMAVQRGVAKRWKAATGVAMTESYGLTEASPGALSNPLNDTDWTGTIGMPLPSTEVCILDDGGREMPLGEEGEISLRGPQVMSGYWGRPDETAKVFSPDGWLRTGDMGLMDARGYVTLTSRKKDIIIVAGFKVFPREIEDLVALHPGVLEVAAVGVPDARAGEVVKIIVLRRDPTLSEQALLAYCKPHLADYKMPQLVEFRSEPLPKSHLGKILRRQLQDEHQTQRETEE